MKGPCLPGAEFRAEKVLNLLCVIITMITVLYEDTHLNCILESQIFFSKFGLRSEFLLHPPTPTALMIIKRG